MIMVVYRMMHCRSRRGDNTHGPVGAICYFDCIIFVFSLNHIATIILMHCRSRREDNTHGLVPLTV